MGRGTTRAVIDHTFGKYSDYSRYDAFKRMTYFILRHKLHNYSAKYLYCNLCSVFKDAQLVG
jgi:hypothetical protein